MRPVFSFEELDLIINARSLAIVGASDKPAKFGSALTASQLAMNFDGPMYLVNPSGREAFGRPVFPDLSALPEPPELVYITVPAHQSLPILEECSRLGVRGVVMIAAGFGEAGEEGRVLEQQALTLARKGGFRIIGPNCFGIYNPRNRLTLLPGYDFSTVQGDVAFISQSGGFAAQVARLGCSLGFGFRAVVSYGNGADVDEVDLLRYFSRDEGTRVIAGYLEGVKNARAFLEALDEAVSRKTVVLWKVGRCESSQKAVQSHTGSLAGSSEIWEAALRQRGVISVFGVEEVCDVLLALRCLGLRPGKRLLLAGGGGGLGTYAADLAAEEGLEIPPLASGTASRLLNVLKGAGAVVSNPLDIGAPLIHLPVFEAVLKEAAANPSTDLLVFDLAVNFGLDLAGEEGMKLVTDLLIRTVRESGRPLAGAFYTRSCDADNLAAEKVLRLVRARLHENGIPVFPSMPRTLRAIAAVNQAAGAGPALG